MNMQKIVKSIKIISVFLLVVMFASLFTACTSGSHKGSTNQKHLNPSAPNTSNKMANSNSTNDSLNDLMQQMDNVTADLVQANDSGDGNDTELVDLLTE